MTQSCLSPLACCLCRNSCSARTLAIDTVYNNDWTWSNAISKDGEDGIRSYDGSLSHDPLKLLPEPDRPELRSRPVHATRLYEKRRPERLITMFTHQGIREMIDDNSNGYSKLFVRVNWSSPAQDIGVASPLADDEVNQRYPKGWLRESQITKHHVPQDQIFELLFMQEILPHDTRYLRLHPECMQFLVNRLLDRPIISHVTAKDWHKLDHEALVSTLYSFISWQSSLEEEAASLKTLDIDYSAPQKCLPIIGSILDKALRHLIFETDRFNDKSLPLPPRPVPVASNDIFAHLPTELRLMILEQLSNFDTLAAAWDASPALARALELPSFWVERLRSHTSKFLPELLPLLKAPSDVEHVDFRKLVGWAEVVSRPRVHSNGWGGVLATRRVLFERTERVVRRYRESVLRGLCGLGAPDKIFTSEVMWMHLGGKDYLERKENPIKAMDLPAVSSCLMPYLGENAPERILRIRRDVKKPIIELEPIWDQSLIGTRGYPKELIVKADEKIVAVEYEVGLLALRLVDSDAQHYGIKAIRLIGDRGSQPLVRLSESALCIPVYYQYLYEPNGILFIEQMRIPTAKDHCDLPLDDDAQQSYSPWNWDKPRICGFRAITQLPPDASYSIDENRMSNFTWAHNHETPGYRQLEWFAAKIVMEPSSPAHSYWNPEDGNLCVPSPRIETICVETAGNGGFEKQESRWKLYVKLSDARTPENHKWERTCQFPPEFVIHGIELTAKEGLWKRQVIGITEEEAAVWPKHRVRELTIDSEKSWQCVLRQNDYLQIKEFDSEGFKCGTYKEMNGAPYHRISLFDEEMAFCGFAMAMETRVSEVLRKPRVNLVEGLVRRRYGRIWVMKRPRGGQGV